MKILTLVCTLVATLSGQLVFANSGLKNNFVLGNPKIASLNALTFGPEGILFIGDSKNAMVYAVDTRDTEIRKKAEPIEMKHLDRAIALVLGSMPEQVHVQDIAVNPLSKKLYLAVHHEDGTPVLMKLEGNNLEWIPLDKVGYSKASITGALPQDAKDKRGRDLRKWTVSDLSYDDGKVMVTGLSNKEFSSTFRSISFPFDDKQQDATLEIYHAAHGRYETYAPVKAFTPATVGGKKQLIAAYTCTPLVLFPMDELKPGQHTKGRTVAELGNWNTPLDMIVMEKADESYLLMANTNRAVMKIKLSDLEAFQGSLTEKISVRGGTSGVNFIALPWVNVLQLDKLDNKHFVMLKRESNGDLNLITQTERWL